MLKAVIFDLDGTLLDTIEDIAISCNHVLEYYKKTPLSIEEFKLYVGQGALKLFEDLLPELSSKEQKEALEIFEQHYRDQFNKNTKVYEGIDRVLTFFQTQDIKMAVLSNKPDSFTKMCIAKYFKNWNFDAVYGIRENIPRKPDKAGVLEILKELKTDANQTLFIGDTKIDMQTAKNAKMDSIGVLWGFRDKKELIKHGATNIAKYPLDIIKIVNNKA